MPTTNGGHLFLHTIIPDNITPPFSKSHEKFEPISGEPTDSHLAELHKILSQIFFDEENGIYNLVSIIQDTSTYTTYYTAAFPRHQNPDIYNTSITDDKGWRPSTRPASNILPRTKQRNAKRGNSSLALQKTPGSANSSCPRCTTPLLMGGNCLTT